MFDINFGRYSLRRGHAVNQGAPNTTLKPTSGARTSKAKGVGRLRRLAP
jgi:hypothetical protein